MTKYHTKNFGWREERILGRREGGKGDIVLKFFDIYSFVQIARLSSEQEENR
jgi:hypothetical protein